MWGVMPVYFKQLTGVSAFDIVAHRVVWSIPFLALLITLTGGWREIRRLIGQRKVMALLALSAVLIGANWVLFVYAVTSGFILAASLGYYLNPLANVLMGRFILGEKLSRLQWGAVALAAAGIAVLAAEEPGHLWISLILAITFATYGLIRKTVAADAVPGLFFETGWMFPLAILWLVVGGLAGQPVLGTSSMETSLLLAAGVVSTVPLLLFTGAARRLRYSTIGMLQFIAPSLQFALAVAIYGEPLGLAKTITFVTIWTALALYVAALAHQSRGARLPPPPE